MIESKLNLELERSHRMMQQQLFESQRKTALEFMNTIVRNITQERARLAQDFKDGKWGLPEDQIPQRQAELRKVNFSAQAAKEQFVSQFGTEMENRMYGPLVTRRQVRDMLCVASGQSALAELAALHMPLRADGELFTFDLPEKVIDEVHYCGCGYEDKIREYTKVDEHLLDYLTENEFAEAMNQHMEFCEQHRIEKEEREVTQAKHSIGNWNCRGCLRSMNKQEGGTDADINWCPKFLVALSKGRGPKEYSEVIRKVNPDMPVCYAGLMHSQWNREVDQDDNIIMVFRWKCDTCGHETIDKKVVAKQATVEEADLLFPSPPDQQ